MPRDRSHQSLTGLFVSLCFTKYLVVSLSLFNSSTPSLKTPSAYFIWFFELLILLRMTLVLQQISKFLSLKNFIAIYMIVIGTFLVVRRTTKFLWMSFIMYLLLFWNSKKGCYQEAIEDITKRMGAGMAKFICKEVETVGDYDEYCHYVAGLVGLGLSKLFHTCGTEDLAPDTLSNSMGLFLQKTNIIRDYLEDINEIPKSRMFWPRQIWGKYVNKLEDLKYEENSVKAVQCLNDMVTNALIHVDDCLKYMSALRDPAIFRFCAIPQVMAIGTLALCYNNIEVFRGVVKMRRGLTAKVIDRTNTMADVYGAFYDFSCMLKAKVDKNDPCAQKTSSRLDSILKTCRDSGVLNERKSYIIPNQTNYTPLLAVLLFILLAITLANRGPNGPN
uniref:Squalene synthase n=1 Tax=Gossypium raimondii TaxID=29730 RepID=A0A0D2NI28_GOSRA|nr:hypothetical protein B456_005G247700 [Gossypium raimondii]